MYREGQKEVVAMKTIITIGREFGSGGHQIGKILADDLGIPYYDKELLERAAKDSGLCKEILKIRMKNRQAVFCILLLWIRIPSVILPMS